MSCVWKTALVLLFFCSFGHQQQCPQNCSGRGSCSGGICDCLSNWVGSDCSISLQTLSSGVPVESQTTAWKWSYYVIANPNPGGIKVDMYPASTLDILSDCDIFIRKDELPSTNIYDYANTNWGTSATIVIDYADPARYYIGVFANFIRCHYLITATVTGACPGGCNHGTCGPNATCNCFNGWGGSNCNQEMETSYLPLYTTWNVDEGHWAYYKLIVGGEKYNYLHVIFNITSLPPELHDCDIYARRGDIPNVNNWDYKDSSTETSVSLDIPSAESGDWYIGVWGYKQCSYSLSVTKVNSGCTITRCSYHGTCDQNCWCLYGYDGDYCQNRTFPLMLNEVALGYVSKDLWNLYYFYNYYDYIIVNVDQYNSTNIQDCDVYIRLDEPPTREIYDYVDISVNNHVEIELSGFVDRIVYIGVFGWYSTAYTVQITINNSCVFGCHHGECLGQGVCLCYSGWMGTHCDIATTQRLLSGKVVYGNITESNQWCYYEFTSMSTTVIISMKEEGFNSLTGVLYLFVAEDTAPTLRDYNYLDIDLNKQFHTIQMQLDDRQYKQSNWTIGVYGSIYVGGETNFQLVYWEPEI